MGHVEKNVPLRRKEVQNGALRHSKKPESTPRPTTKSIRRGQSIGEGSGDAQGVNVSSKQKIRGAHVVVGHSDVNQEVITDTKAQQVSQRSGRRKGKGRGLTSDEEVTYSYHFQCYNCLKMHEGITKSKNQLLEIECKELMHWNPEVNAPDLLDMLGHPRVCGRLNHVYGRRIKTRS